MHRNSEIPPRSLNTRLYYALRRAGFGWYASLRIMWFGGVLSVQPEGTDAQSG